MVLTTASNGERFAALTFANHRSSHCNAVSSPRSSKMSRACSFSRYAGYKRLFFVINTVNVSRFFSSNFFPHFRIRNRFFLNFLRVSMSALANSCLRALSSFGDLTCDLECVKNDLSVRIFVYRSDAWASHVITKTLIRELLGSPSSLKNASSASFLRVWPAQITLPKFRSLTPSDSYDLFGT
jgi:hypothetical protein